jgi:hypothetical protein
LFCRLTYGFSGLLLSDEHLRFLGVRWKKNKEGATGIRPNFDAQTSKFNDFRDSVEGSQKMGRDIPNGVGEVRKRVPSQRQNERGIRRGRDTTKGTWSGK